MTGGWGDLGADPQPVDTSLLPRDPTVYGLTDHFQDRCDDDDRLISRPVGAEVVATGTVDPGRRGCWKFRLPKPGLVLVLVCGLGEELAPVVVTGYAEVEHATKAILDGGFDRRQVKVENFRNAVTEDQELTHRARRLSFSPPTPMDGHRIYTHGGEGALRCDDCGRVFGHRSDVSAEPCR